MPGHHFLLGLGVTVPPQLAEDDDALSSALDALLLVSDKALNRLEPTEGNYRASVSAHGPMFAFPDDDTNRVTRFLNALAHHAAQDEQFAGRQLSLKGAVAWGALQLVQKEYGLNFEGSPAIAAARLLAQTDSRALAIHESAKRYWPPQEVASSQPVSIPGKHPGESYTAVILREYFGVPSRNDRRPTPLISRDTGSPRFLRRRCRALPADSVELRALCRTLLTERPSADERARALTVIRDFKDSFSACIGRAIYLESIGNIEQMLSTLDSVKFTGVEECCRRLLKALALDKLDKCEEALSDLTYVLMHAPASSELIVAAQFNAAVCNEKLQRFELVRAERFLEDRSFTFSTGEKLWPKALSLELIVCRQTGTPFTRRDLVEAALKEEYPDSPKGFVKTLLNWHALTNEPLSDENVVKILELESSMTVTARAGILGQLVRSMPAGPRAEGVRELLEGLIKETKSDAVRKWGVTSAG